MRAEPVTLTVDDQTRVSGLLLAPADARAGFVFAHGAGAGMDHRFMGAVADGLAQRRIATLRYQFPFMERGSRRTDSPAVAHATVRSAVGHAMTALHPLPLVAGGKSFGGRMTSQAEAKQPLGGVIGLAFLGFPLHPAGKPSAARGDHLAAVGKPMLFLQGTRDTLAEPAWLTPVLRDLGPRARHVPLEAADHSFHVLVRSGRTDAQVLTELLDEFARWTFELLDR